jgi:uncharacterized membrane protein
MAGHDGELTVMLHLHERSWLRDHANAPITAVYVVVALVLGSQGGAVGARLIGSSIASISSGSAIAILGATASGTMALTAIVFSLVLVALQVGGSAYSPRVVDILNRNTFLGHALGVFTGTFLYALLAIRTVDLGGDEGVNLSVIVVALIWVVASVVVLTLLLPQVRTLAIAVVLPALHQDAAVATARVYQRLDHDASRLAHTAPTNLVVTSELRHRGPPRYLVGFDVGRLVRCAAAADAVIVLPAAIGDAVIAGDQLAAVHGASKPINEVQLRSALWLEPQRTLDNDPAYSIRLLVDIAIRALSPAINDPTTAVSVLDEIDGVLRLLGGSALEDNVVFDEHGVVRIVRAVPSWDDFVALALTEIHQYGRDSFQVQRRLSAMLHDLAKLLPRSRRPALEQFARWRTDSQSEVLHAATSWVDAFAVDRQGLGHEILASDELQH